MDFIQLVDGYTPTDEAKQLIKTSRIVLLAGIAGAGKDTIKRDLLKIDAFRDIVSHTTRKPRFNNGILEQEGREYHFISPEQAKAMIAEKAFIEVKCVHGDTIYGTSVEEIRAGYEDGKISVTDIDIQGVDEYKQISQGVTAIFILPPSYEVWRERLMKRYLTSIDFETEWPKRRASALKELSYALSLPYYHFIINDNLTRSVEIASSISNKPDAFHRNDDEARLAARDLLEQLQANN